SIDDDTLILNIIEEVPTTELPCTIKLYQALPKGDRMETIIEKCTELGVSEVIPVEMKYCVVKLDDKKKAKKVERYQNIARSAAQQSKRSVIPTISNVISFKEAVADAAESDIIVVPYENKNGMKETVNVLSSLKSDDVISVFIGPEGGFAAEEIESLEALDKSFVISLGKRILRTDTAAITSLSMIMLQTEQISIK
nr:16S rRNA (uracil(1498)-N(3))-methyltransferase [Lachnospiraceae bacterium]